MDVENYLAKGKRINDFLYYTFPYLLIVYQMYALFYFT